MDRNLGRHVLSNIADEEAQNDGDAAKRNRDVIWQLVRLGPGLARGGNDDWVSVSLEDGRVCSQDPLHLIELAVGDVDDDVLDGLAASGDERVDNGLEGDCVLCHEAQVLCCLAGHEVDVDGVADCAADVADAEGEGGDGGDVLVWSGDLGNDGRGDNDGANGGTGNGGDGYDCADIVRGADGEEGCAGGCDGGDENHNFAEAAAGKGDQE